MGYLRNPVFAKLVLHLGKVELPAGLDSLGFSVPDATFLETQDTCFIDEVENKLDEPGVELLLTDLFFAHFKHLGLPLLVASELQSLLFLFFPLLDLLQPSLLLLFVL